MDVGISEFAEGARKARGIAVIIDVFRAFSVACYSFDAGVAQLITTGDIDEAFRLKDIYKNSVLIGERDEKKIPQFDFGNSPTEIIKTDLHGKTAIQTTTAGTNGLANATNASAIITGSLVNISAIVEYIKALKPEYVSLVAMGYRATVTADEDIICAEMIKAGLEGKEINFDKRISDLKNGAGKRFFNPENIDFSPPTDFFLCTMTDRFRFILKGEKRLDGNIALMKIDI